MLFLCSDTTNRQYCLIAYRTSEISTLYYLEGPTKELVSPFKFILPSDKNMRTSQQSKDSLKTVQDIFLRSERSVLQGSPFVRLAGFSGFSATVMMVYRNFLLENEKKGYDKAVAEAGLIEARMIKFKV